MITINSKRNITIAACALFIMLGFLSGGIAKLLESKEETLPETTENVTAFSHSKVDVAKDDRQYTLKIQDGILVVFNDMDDTRPIIVTDIYASTLRNFDREQLTKGLVVNGETELQRLLEDFTS